MSVTQIIAVAAEYPVLGKKNPQQKPMCANDVAHLILHLGAAQP